ncbi:MAG: SIS domain-containing protein [Bradymonadia bacterium]
MLTNVSNPMLDAVRGTSSHFQVGWDAATAIPSSEAAIDYVTVCGMGGSAFPGDIINAVYGAKIRINVNRDYVVPSQPGRGLFIVSSFSGNTEETVAALDSLIERGDEIVIVTAGGKLVERARSHGIPLVLLEKPSPTFQPRAASGIFVGAFLKVLCGYGLLDSDTVLADLRACSDAVVGAEGLEHQGVAFAASLEERTPIFYADGPFVETVAQVSKIKFNENAKIPSFYGALPEFNHNEMVGYTQRADRFHCVFFRNPKSAARALTRLDTSVNTLRKHGANVSVIELMGPTLLAQIYLALLVMDYASIAAAFARDIDPNPVAMVEDFKADLGAFEGYQAP